MIVLSILMVKKLQLTFNNKTYKITHTCQRFSLETHHRKSELFSILDLPILGFLTKMLILVLQKNFHMITQLLQLPKRLNKKLKLLLDLGLLLDTSTLMMLELVLVTKNLVDKSTLKIKNSVMLKFKKQFSMVKTLRLSLEWLILPSLRRT